MTRQEQMIADMKQVRKEIAGSKFADKYDMNEQAIVAAILSVPDPIWHGAGIYGRTLGWLAAGQERVEQVFPSSNQFADHILKLTQLAEKLQ